MLTTSQSGSDQLASRAGRIVMHTGRMEPRSEMSDDTPPYFGHRQRLRDRFLKSGLESFADYEVVELLLTLAIPRSDAKQPAKALIARFGNLRTILDAPIEELRLVPGIG